MAIRVPIPAHEEAEGPGGHRGAAGVAFEDLWQHRAALRDICQRIVGDAATADDVVQETYLRALRNLDSLEQRPSLMPWLATVARRRSIDELRRRQYQRPVDAVPEKSTKPELDPGETTTVSETVARVREALTALTDRERELLMRQVNQGASLAQLAEFDESSVASVRSVLSRARTKLRDALDDAGARVVAPVVLAGTWARRKIAELNVKAQRVSVMPGGYERIAEVATATAVAGALTVGGVLPMVGGGAFGSDADQRSVEVAAASVSDQDVAGGTAFEAGQTLTSPHATGGLTGAGLAAGADATPGGAKGGTLEAESEGLSPRTPRAGAATPEGTPTPNPHQPRSVPDADSPFQHEEPASPAESDVTQLVSPGASGAGGSDHVFAFSPGACGVGCSALWYSADAGDSWTLRKAEGLEAHTLVVPEGYSAARPVLFAMGESGLLVSSDGGEHFAPVASAPHEGPAAISPDFFGADPHVYLGASPNWKYNHDSELTAPLTMGLPAQLTHFSFASSSLVFAGTRGLGAESWEARVYRCVDGDCASSVALDGFEVAPEVFTPVGAGGDVVLAWVGATLFRSGDGAASFARVTLPTSERITGITADADGRLFASVSGASGGGLLRSLDDGATWTVVGAGTALADGVDAVTVAGDVLVAAPQGTGLLCSRNRGTTWKACD